MPITSEGADLEIVRKVQDIIEQYEAAAARLRQLSNKPQVDGITGYHEFPSLAEDYESRAQKYRLQFGPGKAALRQDGSSSH